MDADIKPYIDALERLCNGEADCVDAGPVKFRLLSPGIVFITIYNRRFLYFREATHESCIPR